MKRVTLAVLGMFVLLLLGSGLLAYYFYIPGEREATSRVAPADSAQASATPTSNDEIPLIGELFGRDGSGLTPSTSESWESLAARIALRFSLAAFLAALLAFRPRRGTPIFRRNPYVAQTQILKIGRASCRERV